MATRLHANLIYRASQLGLFQGSAEYYFPEGEAAPEERDHMINVSLRAAIERLEAKK